jgi:hypothetical protein
MLSTSAAVGRNGTPSVVPHPQPLVVPVPEPESGWPLVLPASVLLDGVPQTLAVPPPPQV